MIPIQKLLEDLPKVTLVKVAKHFGITYQATKTGIVSRIKSEATATEIRKAYKQIVGSSSASKKSASKRKYVRKTSSAKKSASKKSSSKKSASKKSSKKSSSKKSSSKKSVSKKSSSKKSVKTSLNILKPLSSYTNKGFTFEQMLNDSGVYFINHKTCDTGNEEIESLFFVFNTFADLKNAFNKQVKKIRNQSEEAMFEDSNINDRSFMFIANQSLDQGNVVDIVLTSKLSQEELNEMDDSVVLKTK